MNGAQKFMLKQMLWSALPLIIGIILMIGIEYYFAITNDEPFGWESIPFFLTAFIPVQIFMHLRAQHKIKKMGIDMSNPLNQKGTLTKTLEINLSQENIIDCLNKHSWKFKIVQQEEKSNGVLLYMKYYQLSSSEKLEIFILPKNNNTSEVSITSGSRRGLLKFISHASFWEEATKHIQYFIDILSKKEEINTSHLKIVAS